MNKSSFARKKRLAYIKSIIFPSKLFHRFLLIILLPMLLIQSIGLYIFFDRHLYNIHKRLAFAISGEANIALALADGETPYNDIFREFNEETGLTLSYIDRFSINSDKGISKATKESFDAEFASYRFKKLANKEFLLQVKSKNNNFIQVLIPFKRLYNSTFHIFILWNIGLSILFLSMAVIFMKNQIKPINKLANAADIFGKGINDDKYLKISGAKEVKQATSAFLKMRDRIKKQVEQRTDMLAGISHDLRTPLTRMKLEISMMENQKEHKDLLKDIKEMEEMLKGYIDFTKGGQEEKTKKVNFNEYLSEIVKTETKHYKDGFIDVHFEQNIEVFLKPKSFRRALANIISNGCKYAKNVWIQSGIRDEYLEINIDDDGKGIAPKDIENVFKPFVRLEKSRNKKTGGIGLGLSVARDIVNSHGGTITLGKSPYKGLRVTIKIPIES